ncbi:MAG: hypothetical protein CMJ23_09205 [Phycisphaerae bacterium]|nr:hypothetical protein [Phycisphaerae bacterium]
MNSRHQSDDSPPPDPVERHGLDLMARRDHFSSDLRDRLLAAGFLAESVENVIASFQRRGLLDDDTLASHKIARWRAAGRSAAECRARLETAGADDSSISAGLAIASSESPGEDPELDAAILIIERTRRGATPPDSARLMGRLARRGFDADTIRAALRHCGLHDESQPEDPTP